MRPLSDIKQRLLEKLRHIGRKKESVRKSRFRRRLKRRFDQPSQGLFSFTKDKYEAVQEAQRILGFTDEELRIFFALLRKADDGYLGFHLGVINIEFHITAYGDDDSSSEILVRVEVNGEEITRTAEYKFPNGLSICKPKKHKNAERSEN